MEVFYFHIEGWRAVQRWKFIKFHYRMEMRAAVVVFYRHLVEIGR